MNKNQPQFMLILFFGIIIILYISSIIYYLNNLKNCSCYQEIDKNNYSNLTYLVIIEAIILSFNIILFILYSALIFYNNKLQKGGNKNINYLIYLLTIIPLIIYGVFFYYIYKLHQNLNKNNECECSKSKLIYLLYLQCIFMIGGLIFSSITLLKI